MKTFSVSNLFPDSFKSGGLTKKELEQIIKESVSKEYPYSAIKNIVYNKDGIEAILDDGNAIIIEIDWNEFILE